MPVMEFAGRQIARPVSFFVDDYGVWGLFAPESENEYFQWIYMGWSDELVAALRAAGVQAD